MVIQLRGIKAWLVTLVALIVITVALFLVFQILIFLLPLAILIVVVFYFFRILNKVKKDQTKEYVDIKFKIKK